MDIKQLQALADKMAWLKTQDDEDRFNEGIDAAINILNRAIRQIETQDKIAKLHQQIAELQNQLEQGDDSPVVGLATKPKGRRGRPPKSEAAETADEAV